MFEAQLVRNVAAVTGLRGVAAVSVLAFHAIHVYGPATSRAAGAFWSWTAAYGYLGVDLFLVLSGFLLAGSLLKQAASPGARIWFQFVSKRWIRTAPPYYVAILVALAAAGSLSYVVDRPGDLLAHLLFVPTHDAQVVGSVNVVFWSLAVEFQMYLLMPLMVWLLVRRPAWVLAGSLALSVLWPLFLVRDGHPLLNFWVITQLPAYLFHFALGCQVARMHANNVAMPGRPWLLAAGAMLVMMAITYLIIPPMGLGPQVPAKLTFALWRVVPAAGMAVLIHAAATTTGTVQRILGSSPLVEAGKVSYSLYLTHLPVMALVGRHSPWVFAGGFSTYLLLMLVACVAVAWLFYQLVERPALAWKSRRSVPAARRAPLPNVLAPPAATPVAA